MAIRNFSKGWAAIAVGVLLLSGVSRAARADDCEDDACESRWDRFKSRCQGNDCNDCDQDPCCESRWDRAKCWCRGTNCRPHCHAKCCKKPCPGCYRRVNGCYGVGGVYGGGNGGGYGGGYGGYQYGGGGNTDPRDTQLYSSQVYGTPIAVPLAPVVKHSYNYGWGIPSSRLTRIGAQYTQWHPQTPYSQTGGSLPGGIYPTVYQPTDTTQQGYYYMHAPRWGRYGWYVSRRDLARPGKPAARLFRTAGLWCCCGRFKPRSAYCGRGVAPPSWFQP